jgi:hypothetical protein
VPTDTQFLKTFINTYRSFTTPRVLLKKLIERYQAPAKLSVIEREAIHIRVCNALKLWISKSIQDFDGAEMMEMLVHFVASDIAADHKELASNLRKQIDMELAQQQQRHQALLAIPPQVCHHCDVRDSD